MVKRRRSTRQRRRSTRQRRRSRKYKKKRTKKKTRKRRGGVLTPDDTKRLEEWLYILPKDTLLSRYESGEKKKDKHKFFSYFRIGDHKTLNPWGPKPRGRGCDPPCTYLEARPKKNLRLLTIPYKTGGFGVGRDGLLFGTTKQDKRLARILKKMVGNYRKGKTKTKDGTTTPSRRGGPKCMAAAINELIELDKKGEADECRPDWDILYALCDNGYDGFVRVINYGEDDDGIGDDDGDLKKWIESSKTKTHAFDEVAICNVTTNIKNINKEKVGVSVEEQNKVAMAEAEDAKAAAAAVAEEYALKNRDKMRRKRAEFRARMAARRAAHAKK